MKEANNRDSPSGLFLVQNKIAESLAVAPFLVGVIDCENL